MLEVVGDFGSSCAAFDIEKLIVMTINTHTQRHTPHTRTHTYIHTCTHTDLRAHSDWPNESLKNRVCCVTKAKCVVKTLEHVYKAGGSAEEI